MMNNMKRTLIALSLLAVTFPCHAIDGNALKEWCHQVVEKAPGRDPMTFRDGYCMGMVEGVMALATQRSLNAFCPPAQIGKTMLLRTIIGFLDSHPEQLNRPAEKLVLDALGETYPCQPPVVAPNPEEN
jgi:hypothetical protein